MAAYKRGKRFRRLSKMLTSKEVSMRDCEPKSSTDTTTQHCSC
jgi:hypothetical protein